MKVITFDSNLRKNPNITHKRDFIKTKLTKLIAIVVKFFNVRDKLPTICVFGRDDSFKLVTPVQEDYEEKRLDCRCYSFDSNLDQILTHDKPQVIITIGNRSSFSSLSRAPFEIRKRWLHYDTMPDLTRLGTDAFNHYLRNMFTQQEADDSPLVTVFTLPIEPGKRSTGHFDPSRNRTTTIGNGSLWMIQMTMGKHLRC